LATNDKILEPMMKKGVMQKKENVVKKGVRRCEEVKIFAG